YSSSAPLKPSSVLARARSTPSNRCAAAARSRDNFAELAWAASKRAAAPSIRFAAFPKSFDTVCRGRGRGLGRFRNLAQISGTIGERLDRLAGGAIETVYPISKRLGRVRQRVRLAHQGLSGIVERCPDAGGGSVQPFGSLAGTAGQCV